MKNLYKIFLLVSILLAINFSNVYAENCGVTAGLDPTEIIVPTKDKENPYKVLDDYVNNKSLFGTTNDKTHELTYDITYVKLDKTEQYLYFYGFAFERANDNDMGGTSNSDKSDDTKVRLALVPNDKVDMLKKQDRDIVLGENSKYGYYDDVIELDITYASPGNNSNCSISGCSNDAPKFYDYTYWNCYRGNGGRCLAAYTFFLYGGFRARLDLTKLQSDKKYSLMMIWHYENVPTAPTGSDHSKQAIANKDFSKWREVAIALNNVDSSVGNLIDMGSTKIKISGLDTTVKTVVGEGRLMGPSGFYCDSGSPSNKGTSYFKNNSIYDLGNTTSDLPVACRGGNVANNYAKIDNVSNYTICSNDEIRTGAGSILMYPLKVSKTNRLEKKNNQDKIVGYFYGRGNDMIAYAPITWISHTGTVKFEVVTEKQNDHPTCRDADHPNEYLISYLFLKSGGDGFNSDGILVSDGSSSTFNDLNILKEVGVTSLSNVKSSQGIYYLNKNNIVSFYDTYLDIFRKMKSYLYNTTIDKENAPNYIIKKDANDTADKHFYAIHHSWSSSDGVTHYTIDNPSMNYTSEQYAAASVNDVETEIKGRANESHTGFSFTVTRKLTQTDPNNWRQMLKTGSKVDTNTVGTVYFPAVYEVAYCPGNIPVCDDEIDDASCSGTSGTTALFHESNDLKACTLNPTIDSGFSIINKGEEESKNKYCEVSCKDDIDFMFPTKKVAKSGTYFVLDLYTPSGEKTNPRISATRTCVSSEVNYSKFLSELAAKESEIVMAFNTWQDWVYIDKNTSWVKDTEGDVHTHEHCSPCTGKDNKPTTCCTPGYQYWTHYPYLPANTGPNYSTTKVRMAGVNETYNTGCEETPEPDYDAIYKNLITDPKNAAYENYVKLVKEYNRMINNFKKCTEWADSIYDDDYKFEFNPTLRYEYDDKYNEIFSGNFTNSGGNMIPSTTKSEMHKYYGKQDTTTDSQYKENLEYDSSNNLKETPNTITYYSLSCPCGDSDPDNTSINGCSGDSKTCTLTRHKVVEKALNTNSFVKRTEFIDLSYELPTVYSSIPDGKASTSAPKNYITLTNNASPVDINSSGSYEYSIKITDLMDSVRKKYEGKSIGNLTNRFETAPLGDLSSGKYVCDYETLPDIIDNGKLNYFYRTIDPNNLDPQKRYTKNKLGYNWAKEMGEGGIVSAIQKTDTNYQTLTNNDKDNDETNVFEFVLTPTAMKSIRDYNKKQSENGGYSDWTLDCESVDGADYCTSKFLTCMASAGQSTSLGRINSFCNNIFGTGRSNVLRGYTLDYNFDSLNDNRDKLKNRLEIAVNKSTLGGDS